MRWPAAAIDLAHIRCNLAYIACPATLFLDAFVSVHNAEVVIATHYPLAYCRDMAEESHMTPALPPTRAPRFIQFEDALVITL